jgi:hypothetical protein
MGGVPKEEHSTLWQTARHADLVPLFPLARVEQFLNRCLKPLLRGWGHQFGVVTTVRRLASAADLG